METFVITLNNHEYGIEAEETKLFELGVHFLVSGAIVGIVYSTPGMIITKRKTA